MRWPTSKPSLFQSGNTNIQMMGIALNQFQPPLNGVETGFLSAFRRIKPGIHRRTQVDIKRHIGSDTDDNRSQRQNFVDRSYSPAIPVFALTQAGSLSTYETTRL
jgi:hypothetical protein